MYCRIPARALQCKQTAVIAGPLVLIASGAVQSNVELPDTALAMTMSTN